MEKKLMLHKDKAYVTLSQLLKIEGFVDSGGEVRFFLANNEVLVNGEPEVRRGKKIYNGDIVQIEDVSIKIVGA